MQNPWGFLHKSMHTCGSAVKASKPSQGEFFQRLADDWEFWGRGDVLVTAKYIVHERSMPLMLNRN